jgi:phosphatidylglycerophosphate synthase
MEPGVAGFHRGGRLRSASPAVLDGMVAIEGGKSTATGALFNEMPDRLSDALFWCRSVMLRTIRG